jgi:DMSO/TMAO reductase YedYZ molybdopterin-dependent catalytic subunit
VITCGVFDIGPVRAVNWADFPVLSAGPTPHISLDRWEFTIDDGINVLKRWNWKSLRDLPTENITVDLHCVTRWSKVGTSWEGVSLDVLLADVKTDLPYAMLRSYRDYPTNLSLKDAMNKQAWIAFKYDGSDRFNPLKEHIVRKVG